MTPDRPKVKAHIITPWRAAVIGAYFCLIVYGAVAQVQQSRIEANGQRGRTAICVEINFLENSSVTTRALIASKPNASENDVRRESADRLDELVVKLRRVVPGCPPLKR